jgi:competence protein ComEC
VIRDVLERQWPAALVGCGCLGIASANLVRLPVLACALLAAAAAGAALLRSAAARLAWLAVTLALLGWGWGAWRLEQLERTRLVSVLGRPAQASVVVTSPPRRSRFAVRAFATVTRFRGIPFRERVLLSLPPGRAPPQGAVLEVRRAWPVEPRGPETGFDERRWLARRGVHVVLRAQDIRVVGRRGGIGSVADRLRTHVESTLGLHHDPEVRSLLRGVVLGADEGVVPSLRDQFRDSGLLHLMAVSGQNVVIVGAGVLGLAWLAAVGRRWAHGGAIVVVAAYALAVGWQPSVVRATVAGCLVSLAWLTSRARDRWHAMGLGALVLLAWLPASILEPGFQLSFAAVAAIFLVVPRIERVLDGYPVPALLVQGVALASACALVTAPIVLAHFGSVPVWAVAANVAAEPAMPPLLGLALTAAVVEPISQSAATALVWLAGWCAWWLALCARLFSGLPLATVGARSALGGLAVVSLAALAFRRLSRPRRRAAAVAAAGIIVVVAPLLHVLRGDRAWAPPHGLRVTFLDVGQGDSVLLEVPEGAVLVDQGPPEAKVAGQLRRLGLRDLAAVVLTHPQRDHIGGAPEVMRRLRVGWVLDPQLVAHSPEREAVLAIAAARHVRVVTARAGDSYRIGGLQLRVLWPDGPGSDSDDPNRRAVVLLASYGEADLLLTADAESDVTRVLPLRRVEVLKVAHHGSEDDGLAEQLRVLRPRVAVISVGHGNDHGHPRPETVATLRQSPGLSLYRTDVDGRVVVESDGHSLTVRTSR